MSWISERVTPNGPLCLVFSLWLLIFLPRGESWSLCITFNWLRDPKGYWLLLWFCFQRKWFEISLLKKNIYRFLKYIHMYIYIYVSIHLPPWWSCFPNSSNSKHTSSALEWDFSTKPSFGMSFYPFDLWLNEPQSMTLHTEATGCVTDDLKSWEIKSATKRAERSKWWSHLQ